jgi:serine/threonine-protein kinase
LNDFSGGNEDVRYILREKAGEGAWGVVWKAEDALFGGVVAIKLIRRGSVSDDEFLLHSLMKEAQLQARLCNPEKHPNIVALTDLRSMGEGNIGLVMEYVDGKTLLKRMGNRNRPTLSLPEFFDYVTQTCSGLQFAHERGVIHRDIKPANLMINADGVVKIVDWGVAKNVEAAGTSATYTGTPPYLPPEVVRLQRMSRDERVRNLGVDHRTDIYSLGVTMYQALTQELPFDGENEIQLGVQQRHSAQLIRYVNSSLADIVVKTMAANAADRYQSARDLQLALQEWQTSFLFAGDLGKARREEADGEIVAAESRFHRLISQHPFNAESYYEAAGFYIRRCREDMAISVLRDGIMRFPGHGTLYEARGRLYAKRGSRLAITDLQMALDLLAPDETDRRGKMLRLMLNRLRTNQTGGA